VGWSVRRAALTVRGVRKDECIALLQWSLPRLGMRWRGFRKVRGQVQKRIARRMAELGIASAADYRRHLEAHPEEWARLDAMCRISISRFFRDRDVWDLMARRLLPELAARAGPRPLRAWCAGCAAGEEPFTLAIVARLAAGPPVSVRITATDADPGQLARARAARYRPGSMRELPPALRDRAFVAERDELLLRPELRAGVEFLEQDIRTERPPGPFDLILCRYLAFTYFDPALQIRIADALAERMQEGAILVLGKRERLPPGAAGFEELTPQVRIYRRSHAVRGPGPPIL
jgi:chemotaxis protein methyltransferase CheR